MYLTLFPRPSHCNPDGYLKPDSQTSKKSTQRVQPNMFLSPLSITPSSPMQCHQKKELFHLLQRLSLAISHSHSRISYTWEERARPHCKVLEVYSSREYNLLGNDPEEEQVHKAIVADVPKSRIVLIKPYARSARPRKYPIKLTV
jgi:hypothetical protein